MRLLQFSAMPKLHSKENDFGWAQQAAYRGCASGSGAWDVLMSLFRDIPASKKGVCIFTLDVPLFVVGIAAKVRFSPIVMVALFAKHSCRLQNKAVLNQCAFISTADGQPAKVSSQGILVPLGSGEVRNLG